MPTPTPIPILYFDDFSNDGSGWGKGDDGNCYSEYNENQYRIVVDRNETCFRPAPKAAEYEHAEFEVVARRSGGSTEFTYGIYINGEGGGQYYLFLVKHNKDNCDWALVRRKSDSSDTKLNGGCDSTTHGYDNSNTLTIRHANNGVITVFLNNTQLGSYSDGSQLGSRGTGLYIREHDRDSVTIRFDNFTVRNVP